MNYHARMRQLQPEHEPTEAMIEAATLGYEWPEQWSDTKVREVIKEVWHIMSKVEAIQNAEPASLWVYCDEQARPLMDLCKGCLAPNYCTKKEG
jgi:hypothetical protein